jgi:hypothetical protein
MRRSLSRGSAAGHKIVDDTDDDEHQEQIDELSTEVSDKSKKPKNEQHRYDGPE